ncbi:MAG: hypothetical protein FJX75_21955 [Armatimonadetes bacterium]|nr:hypothetical protein [Armatimonadota bacterium]
MQVLASVGALALLVAAPGAAEAPQPASPEVQQLLDQALALAQSVPDRAERADAVGRVAGEIARYDPKRALQELKKDFETHEASSAMARAAEVLARDNRLLGLATLLRVKEISTLMVALSRIVAMEIISDYDEARKIVDHVEPITVQRMVEREVTRVVWADVPGDRATAVDAALRWAQGVADPVTRDESLAFAAEGAATLDVTRAQSIADGIRDVEPRDLALRLIVQQVAASDVDAAQALMGRIQTPLQRGLAGAEVVGGLAKAGRTREALALVTAVRTSVAEDLESPLDQALIRERLALAIADLDPPAALSIVSELWPPAKRYAVQCRAARSVAARDPKLAKDLLRDALIEVKRIDAPLFQREIVAEALASAALVAPEQLNSMTQDRPELVQQALPDAVRSLLLTDPEAAVKLTDRIADAHVAQQARAGIVCAVASSHPDLARRVADELQLPGPKSAALVALAQAASAG